VESIRDKAVTSVRSVLIYDDDPNIRASIKNNLQELGFDTVFECCNGMSAVSMACDCLPDIAILDAAILQKDGLSATREIRQNLNIPVILLMSQYDPETLDRAKKIGITTILTKPVRGQDLLPAIEIAFAHAEEVKLLNEHVKNLKKTIESQKIIDKAKKVLVRSEGISESESFRKIQKLAMDKQMSMRQIAESILITNGV
jgi:AmiR/NasT family two-component response regulator